MAGKKSKTEKPPAIDKLLKPAIGVVLALVAYNFMKGINTDVSLILNIVGVVTFLHLLNAFNL